MDSTYDQSNKIPVPNPNEPILPDPLDTPELESPHIHEQNTNNVINEKNQKPSKNYNFIYLIILGVILVLIFLAGLYYILSGKFQLQKTDSTISQLETSKDIPIQNKLTTENENPTVTSDVQLTTQTFIGRNDGLKLSNMSLQMPDDWKFIEKNKTTMTEDYRKGMVCITYELLAPSGSIITIKSDCSEHDVQTQHKLPETAVTVKDLTYDLTGSNKIEKKIARFYDDENNFYRYVTSVNGTYFYSLGEEENFKTETAEGWSYSVSNAFTLNNAQLEPTLTITFKQSESIEKELQTVDKIITSIEIN